MRAVAVVFTLSWALVVVACGPDLGTCDEPTARKLVYLNGVPYTEGQALIHQSCSASLCHAESATATSRNGAPHGLNFDLSPMTKASTAENLVVLQRGVNRIRDEAEEIWAIIESGEMPPGKAGDLPDLPFYRDVAATVPANLAAVDIAESRQLVRNWLACSAPVVAATTDSPQAAAVVSASIGAVVDPGQATIQPNFASIFDFLLGPSCASCHRAAGPYAALGLDFTSADTSFATLVSKPAAMAGGGMCGGMNRQHVVPRDCANSLLWQKLQATVPCGAPMPLGGPPPSEEARKAVCDWITAGAAR
jgi:hypothetical protein